MPTSLARILVRYRLVSVAIVNAGITWTILIIAPLGLFAVIVSTLGVFISSLMMTWFGDRALDHLLQLEAEQLRRTETNVSPNPSAQPFQSDRNFPDTRRGELGDR